MGNRNEWTQRRKLEGVRGIAKESQKETEVENKTAGRCAQERTNMTVEEAKAKIFHWLCSRYHDPGQGNEYIDKGTVREAINVPEEVFEKALNEFVDPGAQNCVEVEIPTGRLRLGTGGLQFCEAGTNPFT
jgi:hypothetical protein